MQATVMKVCHRSVNSTSFLTFLTTKVNISISIIQILTDNIFRTSVFFLEHNTMQDK